MQLHVLSDSPEVCVQCFSLSEDNLPEAATAELYPQTSPDGERGPVHSPAMCPAMCPGLMNVSCLCLHFLICKMCLKVSTPQCFNMSMLVQMPAWCLIGIWPVLHFSVLKAQTHLGKTGRWVHLAGREPWIQEGKWVSGDS